MAERELPLWLVRTHEEKARREAAILATRAAQEAERVRPRKLICLCGVGLKKRLTRSHLSGLQGSQTKPVAEKFACFWRMRFQSQSIRWQQLPPWAFA